jgi:hypothetical protein
MREVACIYADACSDVMARCAAAKLPPVQHHYKETHSAELKLI